MVVGEGARPLIPCAARRITTGGRSNHILKETSPRIPFYFLITPASPPPLALKDHLYHLPVPALLHHPFNSSPPHHPYVKHSTPATQPHLSLIRFLLPTSWLASRLANLLEAWINLTYFCSCQASLSRCWLWFLGFVRFQFSSLLTLHELPSEIMELMKLLVFVRRFTPLWTLRSVF